MILMMKGHALEESELPKLPYPLDATPKIDGIRAMTQNGVLRYYSGNVIPNVYVQAMFGIKFLNLLDGELTCGEPNAIDVFNKTTRAVRNKHSMHGLDVRFNVFDMYGHADLNKRVAAAAQIILDSNIPAPKLVMVPRELVNNYEELIALEERWLTAGYEGVMLRKTLCSWYKSGRSTLSEAYLLKLKRMADSEAVIIGYSEQTENLNEIVRTVHGFAKRSRNAEGLVPAGVLGTITVQDVHNPNMPPFEIYSGISDKDRIAWWKLRDKLCGKIIKYRYQKHGTLLRPRSPVALGFREAADVGIFCATEGKS